MTDEPFTDDQNIVYESGIPVRLYNGGHQGTTQTLPDTSTGDEGDVLTIVDGEPAWAPPQGGGGGSYALPSPYWLTPTAPAFTCENAPISPAIINSSGLGSSLGVISAAEDYVVIGSGSGTAISVALPLTVDGQTFPTPRSGYDVSCYKVGTFDAITYPWFLYNELELSLSSEAVFVYKVLNGASPDTTANAYWSDAQSGTTLRLRYPSGVNTTSSNPTTPYVVGTLTASRTWELRAKRWSFNV